MYEDLYLEFPELLLVLMIFIICAVFCKMKLPSLYFPHVAQFMQTRHQSTKLLSLLKWLGIIMLIISVSSPVKDEPYELEPKDGYEIVLILDASGSMRAQGFDKDDRRKNRFEAVKSIVSDFIAERKNDNIGLVVFGSYSFIASPLTYDENILKRIVSQLQIGIAGEKTALYESLAQGVNLLKMSESKSKIAILLTDGHSSMNVDNIPLDIALDLAKKEGIKVYPIGIGGQGEYNAKVLMQIAKATSGVAFGASNASQLVDIYKEIDALEKSEIKSETFTYLKYYYMYPLFLAFLFLLFYVYLRNKRGLV